MALFWSPISLEQIEADTLITYSAGQRFSSLSSKWKTRGNLCSQPLDRLTSRYPQPEANKQKILGFDKFLPILYITYDRKDSKRCLFARLPLIYYMLPLQTLHWHRFATNRWSNSVLYLSKKKKEAIFDLMLFAQFTSDSLSEEHNVGDVVTFKCLIIPKRFVEVCLPAVSLQFAKHALETWPWMKRILVFKIRRFVCRSALNEIFVVSITNKRWKIRNSSNSP